MKIRFYATIVDFHVFTAELLLKKLFVWTIIFITRLATYLFVGLPDLIRF
jgi:hypothetical protein